MYECGDNNIVEKVTPVGVDSAGALNASVGYLIGVKGSDHSKVLNCNLTNPCAKQIHLSSMPGKSTLGTTIIRDNIGRNNKRSSAPISGYYYPNEIIEHSAPSQGGVLGWACTTEGSPGTWEAYGQVGYRSNAGSPVGAVVPRFVGEELLDSTNKHWYKAAGTTNADWKQTTN